MPGGVSPLGGPCGVAILVVGLLVEHAEQLADAAHEQALLVDLDPGARAGGEDDVVAALDRHPDPRALPPVQARADGEDDPVLGRRLVRALGDEPAGLADAIGLELLDDDAVEERAKEVAHVGVEPTSAAAAWSDRARRRPARGGCRPGPGGRTGWCRGPPAAPAPGRP